MADNRKMWCPVLVKAMVMVWLQALACSSTPIIQAPWGSVQGVTLEVEGRKMDAYRGIPYALPPVGHLRFEKPKPHPGLPKDEVFVADKFKPACPQTNQMIRKSREQSEDCLGLDVFVPIGAANSASPLAVMVFIHGGGFNGGDGSPCGSSKIVADGNVILVVIQYRLGALGFLKSGDGVLPGNFGLWDQNLALKWVKDNIRAFGGDPDRITIFGESAGSMSVAMHMISPQSRGLFKRAIMQSGAPQELRHMYEYFDIKTVFKDVANLFECQGTTQAIVQCLKQQPESVFLDKIFTYAASSPVLNCFFPYTDGTFLPRDIRELVEDEQYMQENGVGDIDLIVGFNNMEGGMVVWWPMFLNLSQDILHTRDFFMQMVEACVMIRGLKQNTVVRKSIEFFYRLEDAGTDKPIDLYAMADMYGDCLINAASVEWTRFFTALPHASPRYMYVFDHDFHFNQETLLEGSFHADELIMLFDSQMLEDSFLGKMNKTSLAPEEQPLGDKLVQIFTTFAKTGNPSGPLKDDLGGEWPQFTAEDESYLSIKMQPSIVRDLGPYNARSAFWNKHMTDLNSLTADLPTEPPKQKTSATKDEL